ncbi:MAG: Fe-S cluster assembly sulfur transfer protein SufU [Candidatus Limnocylindria bacterium]
MNVDLGDLYQEVIIDHGRHPRNFGELAGATHTAEGFNPLCGDQLTLYVKLADGHIAAIAFQGAGCAISQASASLMTTALKGKNEEEALALFGRVHAMLTEGPNGGVRPAELGKLAVLSGVWEFPMRVKCATLAWHTLRSALEATAEPVSTE